MVTSSPPTMKGLKILVSAVRFCLAIPHSPYSFRQVENVSGSRVRLDSLAAQSKNSIALEVLRSGSQARKITSARKDVILRALKAGLNLFSLPLSCDPHHLLYPKS